jgi:hypothetical protein
MNQHPNPYRHFRFSRTMREAYGYDARLERTPAPFKSHWSFTLGVALGCALLFSIMVML